jgi:hypothetical protein
MKDIGIAAAHRHLAEIFLRLDAAAVARLAPSVLAPMARSTLPAVS